MLLGAWPIGGVKHSSLTNSNDKNGKCRFAILCGCYALFLIIGAAIFSVIEAPQLDKYQRELIEVKDKFAQRNPCLSRKFLFYVICNHFTSIRLLCLKLDSTKKERVREKEREREEEFSLNWRNSLFTKSMYAITSNSIGMNQFRLMICSDFITNLFQHN